MREYAVATAARAAKARISGELPMRLTMMWLTVPALVVLLLASASELASRPVSASASDPSAAGEGQRGAETAALEAGTELDAGPPSPTPVPERVLSAELLQQAGGQVRPSREVTLRSPLNEQLKSVEVAESQRVRSGEVLARLESEEQVLAVEAARLEAESEARVRRARVALDEAEVTLEIVESIEAVGPHEVRRTQLQRDQAEADYVLAQEQAEQANLEYERQKARLDRYTIEAPFDGTVHRIEADPGALLSGDQPILSLVALDPLHAEVYMPFESFGEVRVGQEYELRASAPVHQTLTGRLITIDPVLDFPSRQFRCIFKIENPDAVLPAGFRVSVVGVAEGS